MTSGILRLRELVRIRTVEERLAREYAQQRMRCPTYFSNGQEAVAVGVSAALEPGDTTFSAHRNHAHYLARGGSLGAMVAELHGKVGGCAGGRGGSLHLLDKDAGFLGSSPIVGSTIPIAVGVAFANRVRRRSAISTVFFGDGATEAGIFHESLNFAAVHRLAVLFVCENNLYSIYSSLAPRQPVGRRIADVASAMGVRSKRIDGQDVETVYEAAREEVARLRSGDGPGFLECLTYRFVQHVGPGGDDHLAYRPHDEIAHWKAHDPLTIARARAVDAGLAREAEVEAWSKTFEDEVSAAIRDSAAGAFPDRAGVLRHVWAEEATESMR